MGPNLEDAGSRFWVWAIALPVATTVMFMLLMGGEADSSGEMMFGFMMSSVTLGLFIGAMGRGFWQTCSAATWFAVLIAWRRWDWALDLHSPRGSAQAMAESFFGWKNAPGLLAFALFQIIGAASGWGVVALNALLKRKTGWAFFDEA